MLNSSKVIWLVILLIISFIITGIFRYQWWLVKNELENQIEQNESLIKELQEIKEKEYPLAYCGKVIRAPLEQGMRIIFRAFRGGISVISPQGEMVSNEVLEAPGLSYTLLEPGKTDQPPSFVILAWIPKIGREIGDYLVEVAQKPDATLVDTYTLEVSLQGSDEIITLAENIPFGNFPKHLYILRSIEEGIIPIVPTTCEF